MNIVITEKALKKFLNTSVDAETLAENVSLCGPTFDRIRKVSDDTIYEIEAITNRVDTASAMGIAREAHAILKRFGVGAEFTNDPYRSKPDFKAGLSKQFHFEIEKDLVVRFTAISLENVQIKDSPQEVQAMLENSGQRALNNCIDITNELTLLYGMPSHIFDLDKLAAQKLTIRESRNGESLTTLDGKQHQLDGRDIIIEDGSSRIVDLCGVMGGQIAEVDSHTKNILLIVPVYDPQRVRKTSLSVQNRTLASQIYEKQPDPELCLPVLSEAIKLLQARAGAKISSSLFDFYPQDRPPKNIAIDLVWLNKFVGIDMDKTDVISILSDLGFESSSENNSLTCSVPSWRYHDINIREDLVEEIARIYGYFRLPPSLPAVNLPPEPKNTLLETEKNLKLFISDLGYHEIYNSSLISADLIKKTLVDPTKSIKLKNTLSSDYEYLRTSLIPSLLSSFKLNNGIIREDINIFEISNTYHTVSEQVLPDEISFLASISHQNYLDSKGKLEIILKRLKIKNVSFKPAENSQPYFSETGTADIFSGAVLLGSIGSLKPIVLRSFGISSNPTAIEINIVKLASCISSDYNFVPLSEYPLMLENITITSSKNIGELMDRIKSSSKLIQEVQYLQSFESNHTFKVSFGTNDRNLEQSEINQIKKSILSSI